MNTNSIAITYAAMAQVDPTMAALAMRKDGTYWLVAREIHISISRNERLMEMANNMANSPMLSIRS